MGVGHGVGMGAHLQVTSTCGIDGQFRSDSRTVRSVGKSPTTEARAPWDASDRQRRLPTFSMGERARGERDGESGMADMRIRAGGTHADAEAEAEG